MLSFLVNFIHAFIPMALLAGLLVALWPPVNGRRAIRPIVAALACGLLGGGILYFVALHQESVTAARTCLVAAGLLAALLKAGSLLLPGKSSRWAVGSDRGAGLFLASALAAVAAFSFLLAMTEQALSAISVLNTELLLNIGGILSGLLLVVFLIPLTAHLATRSGRGLVSGLFLLSCALRVIPWSADALLGLMRLELVELTSGRLSFVAKVTKYSSVLPYLYLVILAALACLFFARRTPIASPELPETTMAEGRKALRRHQLDRRWFTSALASVGLILAVFLYQDLYASRPPQISTPVELKPAADGLIRIRVDEVADGNLHRFSYVTDDGHVVRFILINRMAGSAGERKKIGVVYDACMLCGDMGYLQEKNEIICIACNVRIFIPSIGKAGGCNPIPFPHQFEGEAIVIDPEELDRGAKYFSQVVAVQVKDPVTGKELSSREAPHRYEYQGRTYFFESLESLEKFQAAPEAYVEPRQSRHFRAQGFQET